MSNIIFVKKRCPLSLSIAGYLLDKQQICREVEDSKQWIIPASDEQSLCFGAVNAIDVIKANRARRVFVQSSSKNIRAVCLASWLLDLELFILDDGTSEFDAMDQKFKNMGSFLSSQETLENFVHSMNSSNASAFGNRSIEPLICSHYPPPSKWFENYSFFTMNDPTLYKHDYFFLPNYIQDLSDIAKVDQNEAEQICEFYCMEASSAWGNFELIFENSSRHVVKSRN